MSQSMPIEGLPEPSATLDVAIYSDVICPWCYIGKRRLERALADAGIAGTTRITWLPFELNPGMPQSGMPRAAYRERKFGAARASQMDAELRLLGSAEGIAFAFDRMLVTPNTRAAHVLIAAAGRAGVANAVKAALLRAYFEEARDIGDPELLAALANENGLPAAEARAALTDGALHREVVALEERAVRIGVSGVPFFILNGTHGVSGAQPTTAWNGILAELGRNTAGLDL